MARAALAVGQPVTLLSAEGAGAYAGAGWWQALVRLARATPPGGQAPDILDCGDAAGRALEALRAGQVKLILRAPPKIFSDVEGFATAQGAVLMAAPPASLDLFERGAPRRLPSWLGAPG